MSGRPWTADEMDVLRWMRANNDSDAQIAEALNRTIDSVRHGLRKEIRTGGVARRERQRPGNAPWTDADRLKLAELHAAGISDAEKAAALNRGVASTKWMLRRGLREGWISKSPFFWTEEKKAELARLLSDGVPPLETSARLKRSRQSVYKMKQYCAAVGLLQDAASDAILARRTGLPADKLDDYRILRLKRFSSAEAAAMCREARP